MLEMWKNLLESWQILLENWQVLLVIWQMLLESWKIMFEIWQILLEIWQILLEIWQILLEIGQILSQMFVVCLLSMKMRSKLESLVTKCQCNEFCIHSRKPFETRWNDEALINMSSKVGTTNPLKFFFELSFLFCFRWSLEGFHLVKGQSSRVCWKGCNFMLWRK